MWSIMSSSWFCYLIGVAIFLLLVYYVTKWMKSQPPLPEDTIYYQVTDVDGNKSIIHDSGIKPSENPPGSNISLQILKREVNNGVEKNLTTPDYLYMGHSPKGLMYKLGVDSNYLTDDGLYYTLSLDIPDGKKPEFPFS